MTHKSHILLSCLIGAALTGCTTVLDTQSNGVSPSGPGNLAGSPSGDSVNSTGSVIYNEGNIQLVADVSEPGRVNLVTGGKPHNTDSYTISLSGVKLTITDAPILAIDALDTNDQLACGLEIGGGEFRLVSGAGTAVVGAYTSNADQHDVVMRLDLAAARCYVVITQVGQGTDGPQTQPKIEANGPLSASDFGDLDRLRVGWENTSGINPTSYFLARTVISKQD